MFPLRNIVLGKAGTQKREPLEPKKELETSPTMREKYDRIIKSPSKRRTPVFDQHDVHPHWAASRGEEPQNFNSKLIPNLEIGQKSMQSDPSTRQRPKCDEIKRYNSMRLANTGTGVSDTISDQHCLDRTKSLSAKVDRFDSLGKLNEQTRSSGPATPNSPSTKKYDHFAMSEVNQMRTDRLANAIKALKSRDRSNSPDVLSRTQSMRNPKGRRAFALETKRFAADCREFKCNRARDETKVLIDFRRRTSSVPIRYDKLRHSKRILDDQSSDQGQEHSGHADQASSRGIDQSIYPHCADQISHGVDQSPYQHWRMLNAYPKAIVMKRAEVFRRRCSSAGRAQEQTSGSFYMDSSDISASRSHSPMQLGMLSPPEPTSPSYQHKKDKNIRKHGVVVLGLENVGKTSIISQFTTSHYCSPLLNDAVMEFEISDNSVIMTFNGEHALMTFIEADNQKSDLSLTLSADGYIVVYGVDDAMSFENATQVLFQLRLQTHSADKPIILVGNKMDLDDRRIVSIEEGKEVAQANDCDFLEIVAIIPHHTNELLEIILSRVYQGDKKVLSEGSTLQTSGDVSHNDSCVCSSPHSSSDSLSKQHKKIPTKMVKDQIFRTAKGGDAKSATSCSNLSAVGHRLADKVFGRRRDSKSLEDIQRLRHL